MYCFPILGSLISLGDWGWGKELGRKPRKGKGDGGGKKESISWAPAEVTCPAQSWRGGKKSRNSHLSYALVRPRVWLCRVPLHEGWGVGWGRTGKSLEWTLTAGAWDTRGLRGQWQIAFLCPSQRHGGCMWLRTLDIPRRFWEVLGPKVRNCSSQQALSSAWTDNLGVIFLDLGSSFVQRWLGVQPSTCTHEAPCWEPLTCWGRHKNRIFPKLVLFLMQRGGTAVLGVLGVSRTRQYICFKVFSDLSMVENIENMRQCKADS